MAERVEIVTGITGADEPEAQPTENPMDMEQEEVSERPEWLPEKFNTPEDMAKAYGELETQMGQESQQVEDTEQETPEESISEVTGLTPEYLEPFSQEFMEHGELSDESFTKLEQETGIPQDIARAYVDGQRAIVEQQQSNVFNEVGGQDTYNDMVEWASENFTEEEITSFDNAVDSGDINTTMMAVRGLQARYAQANGTAPKQSFQGNTTKDSTTGFQSWQQVSAAMRDPKYATDPAYRKQVENRLSVSRLTQ